MADSVLQSLIRYVFGILSGRGLEKKVQAIGHVIKFLKNTEGNSAGTDTYICAEMAEAIWTLVYAFLKARDLEALVCSIDDDRCLVFLVWNTVTRPLKPSVPATFSTSIFYTY